MSEPTHDHDDCRALLALLNDYADGELAAERCADVERHLAQCGDCRALLETLTRTLRLYRHLDDAPAPLPDEIEARLLQAIRPRG